MTCRPCNRSAGFSLIELMISVAIIGILAMVAWPGYESYVLRTRRSDAKTELSSIAQRLERCFSQFGTYLAGTGCSVGNGPFTTPEHAYSIVISHRTATTYTLIATPQNAQTKDSQCGNFTLDHLGVRGATGTQGASRCWD